MTHFGKEKSNNGNNIAFKLTVWLILSNYLLCEIYIFLNSFSFDCCVYSSSKDGFLEAPCPTWPAALLAASSRSPSRSVWSAAASLADFMPVRDTETSHRVRATIPVSGGALERHSVGSLAHLAPWERLCRTWGCSERSTPPSKTARLRSIWSVSRREHARHIAIQCHTSGPRQKVYLSIHGRHSFLLVLEAADDLQQTLHSEQEGTRDMKHCSKRVQPPRGTRVLWQASDEVGGIKWEENNTKKYTITWRRCSWVAPRCSPSADAPVWPGSSPSAPSPMLSASGPGLQAALSLEHTHAHTRNSISN